MIRELLLLRDWYRLIGLRIFGCFPLQEIGMLAHRSDPSDSIRRTIALTTELEMDMAGQPEKPEDRALIM